MDTLQLRNLLCIFAVVVGLVMRVSPACSGLLYSHNDTLSICYWLILSEETAEQAEDKCNADGGMLAYIPNQEALNVVGTLKSDAGFTFGPEFYIGYRESGTQLYVWGTLIQQSFHPWQDGEPDSDAQECVVVFNSDLSWWDEDCNTAYKAVCSDVGPREGSTNTTTTSTTTTPISSTTTPVPTTTTTPLPTTIPPLPTTTTTPLTTTTTTPLTTTTTTPLPTTTTTPLPTTTAPLTTTARPTTTSSCRPCPCYSNTTSNKTIEQFREEIRKEMIVERKSLSSTIRRKRSAPDPRPSAAAVGYIGVIILTVVFGGIVLLDAGHIYICAKTLVKFTKTWLT